MSRIAALFILFTAMCVLVADSRASEVLDEQAFSERYAAQMVATFDVTAEIVAPLEVRIKLPAGETSTSYLDNAYNAYLAEPAELEFVLQRFVNAAGEMFAEVEVRELGSLFPVIKGTGYIAQIREMMSSAEDADPDAPFPLYYEPLNDELVILYAFDSEASIRFASAEDIEALGISGRALQVRALDNLLAYLPEIGREGDDSLSLLIADGNYEASLLLYDEIWSREVFPVAGDIVVFVPARDVLLVTGSEDEQGLARARDLVTNNEFSYAISPHAYVRTANGWERFEP